MAKFFQIALLIAFAAICIAEPAGFQRFRTNRFLARQEAADDNAPPAKAPYPPAGIKPDIPFDLPTETTTAQPDNTYLPPDNTYGPPESTYGPPESTYGPPTTTLVPTTTEISLYDDTDSTDDTESVISVAVSYDNDNVVTPQEPQRIVFGQRVIPLKSEKLRTVNAEPILLDDGSFAYSAQLQNW